MKAAIFYGKKDIRIEDLPMPVPGKKDVLLKVGACGICGTDLTPYKRGAGDVIVPGSRIGHEFMGTIVEVGADVQGIEEGMRVVVNPITAQPNPMEADICGGFSEYKLIENAAFGYNLLELPDALSDEEGAIAEPISVGLHTVKIAEPEKGEKVLILGAGPIGLGVLSILKARGIEDVAVADLAEIRLAKAREFGASLAFDPLKEEMIDVLYRHHGEVKGVFSGTGTDLYIDTAGNPDIYQLVLKDAKTGSRIVVVALYNKPVPVDLLNLLYRQFTLKGSCAYDFETDFKEVIGSMVASQTHLKSIITHRFELSDIAEAFRVASSIHDSIKVVVHMS